MIDIGNRIPDQEIADYFPAEEGELNLFYGQIGSGKTYGATSDIHDDVARGVLVYATWPIKFFESDDRSNWWFIFRNFFLFRKRYFRIDSPKNFHFIDAERGEVDGIYTFDPTKPKAYIEYLNTLNHCKIYIDESWRVFDSYKSTADFGLDVRNLILVTRHKFRTINLIAQRPTSVQVTARANVNRFFKFVKVAKWPWVRFARYEFQDMTGETVDETKEPLSTKTYWGSNKIFASYNSFFYGTLNSVHELRYEAYDLTFKERFMLLLYKFHVKQAPKPWYEQVPEKRLMLNKFELLDLDSWDLARSNKDGTRALKVSYPQVIPSLRLTKRKIHPKITRKAKALPLKGKSNFDFPTIF